LRIILRAFCSALLVTVPGIDDIQVGSILLLHDGEPFLRKAVGYRLALTLIESAPQCIYTYVQRPSSCFLRASMTVSRAPLSPMRICLA
jgi:hypothetical protein